MKYMAVHNQIRHYAATQDNMEDWIELTGFSLPSIQLFKNVDGNWVPFKPCYKWD